MEKELPSGSSFHLHEGIKVDRAKQLMTPTPFYCPRCKAAGLGDIWLVAHLRSTTLAAVYEDCDGNDYRVRLECPNGHSYAGEVNAEEPE